MEPWGRCCRKPGASGGITISTCEPTVWLTSTLPALNHLMVAAAVRVGLCCACSLSHDESNWVPSNSHPVYFTLTVLLFVTFALVL